MRSARLLLALAFVGALVLAGCGSGGSVDAEGSVTVAAATSLTDAFTQIAEDFSAANPGVEVTFTFDASSALATQIIEGAPVDVFASADVANMARVVDEGPVSGEPEVFAGNELVIITKPGNPEGIESLADLADAGVISLCGEEVPCGRYATEALDAADVVIDESNVTRGQNVGATLAAVAEGDAVAGVVYVTDANSAGDTVDAIPIPAGENVTASYPISVLTSAGDNEVARAFKSYILSDAGQAVLADHGFLPPP